MPHIFERGEQRTSSFNIRMKLKEYGFDQYDSERIADIISQEYKVYESYDLKVLKWQYRLSCMILVPFTFAVLMPCKWLITGKSKFNPDSKFSKFMLKIMGQK